MNFALRRLYEEDVVRNRSQILFGDRLCLTLTIKIEMSSSGLLYKEGSLAFSRRFTCIYIYIGIHLGYI